MNGTGNIRSISANSVPRYALIDKDGNRFFCLFTSAESAAQHAKGMWPSQEQDEERTGKGWDIEVVKS